MNMRHMRLEALTNSQGKQPWKQPFTVSSQLMDAHYLITLASGRTAVMKSGYDVYQAAYDAYEEACLMDDYLVNVELISDET